MRRGVPHQEAARNPIGGTRRFLGLAGHVGLHVARRPLDQGAQIGQGRLAYQRQESEPFETVRRVVAARIITRACNPFLHPFIARLGVALEVPLAPARQGIAPIVLRSFRIVVERLAGDHLERAVRAVADPPGPLLRDDPARVGQARQQVRHRIRHQVAPGRLDDRLGHPRVRVIEIGVVALEGGAAGVGQRAHGVLAHAAAAALRVGRERLAGSPALETQRFQDARACLLVVLFGQVRQDRIERVARRGRRRRDGGRRDRRPDRRGQSDQDACGERWCRRSAGAGRRPRAPRRSLLPGVHLDTCGCRRCQKLASPLAGIYILVGMEQTRPRCLDAPRTVCYSPRHRTENGLERSRGEHRLLILPSRSRPADSPGDRQATDRRIGWKGVCRAGAQRSTRNPPGLSGRSPCGTRETPAVARASHLLIPSILPIRRREAAS